MTDTIKALAGLAMLVGLVYAVFYFSGMGRVSPDEAALQRMLQLGAGMGRLENDLGNPVASFSVSERENLDQWLTTYPTLQDFVKRELTGWQAARVYAYDRGYAQAIVLTYTTATGSADGSSTPLIGYAVLPRDSSTIVSSVKK